MSARAYPAPSAPRHGAFKFDGIELQCAVLPTGEEMLTLSGLCRFLGVEHIDGVSSTRVVCADGTIIEDAIGFRQFLDAVNRPIDARLEDNYPLGPHGRRRKRSAIMPAKPEVYRALDLMHECANLGMIHIVRWACGYDPDGYIVDLFRVAALSDIGEGMSEFDRKRGGRARVEFTASTCRPKPKLTVIQGGLS